MADDFTPPGRSEDYPSAPQGYDRLLGELRDIRTRLSDLPHGLLRQAGISVEPETIRFGGNVAIEGTLSLPAGIIDNEALANPLDDGAIGYSETGFAVPTSLSAVASRTITIPDGFTRAIVLGIVSVGAFNGTASFDYLYARASVNGSGGAMMPVACDGGSYATVTVSAIRTLTDLSGGTLPVAIECYAAAGWGSSSANIANIDVIALFRR